MVPKFISHSPYPMGVEGEEGEDRILGEYFAPVSMANDWNRIPEWSAITSAELAFRRRP